MFYKLLGIVVWKAAKSLLRYRYGSKLMPGRVLAGGLVAGLLAVAFATKQRNGD
jgi:hypothetical protein